MSDHEMTQREYYEQIRAIAEEIRKEAEGDNEREHDLVHEAVDGHQWIIYTSYNLDVLKHSRNESAYFADFGALEGCNSFSEVTVKLAYAAMSRDVFEALAELPEYGDESAD